jgi:uncharacterized membrane protein
MREISRAIQLMHIFDDSSTTSDSPCPNCRATAPCAIRARLPQPLCGGSRRAILAVNFSGKVGLMSLVILYVSTAVIFLALDAVMLTFVMRPLFESHVGPLLLQDIRLAPTAVFYAAYVAGLLWLVSLPALREGAPLQALVGGAVIGAMAYGTYEFTNYATLAAWHPSMVATDFIWGTVLTAIAAWAGVTITRALT